jgi:hypothetical protein
MATSADFLENHVQGCKRKNRLVLHAHALFDKNLLMAVSELLGTRANTLFTSAFALPDSTTLFLISSTGGINEQPIDGDGTEQARISLNASLSDAARELIDV